MIARTFLIIFGCLILVPVLAQAKPTPSAAGYEAAIRTAVATYVQHKTAGLGCEVTIRRLTIGGSQLLPEGSLEYEVIAPQQWEGWGSAGLSVIVRQGERVVQNVPVRVEVEALAEMVVTLQQIDYGSVIGISPLSEGVIWAGLRMRPAKRLAQPSGQIPRSRQISLKKYRWSSRDRWLPLSRRVSACESR